MNNKDFEGRLRATLHKAESLETAEGRQKTIWMLRMDMQRQSRRERVGFRTFLSMQMKFIGWKVWLCQGIFLALFTMVSCASAGDYLWETPAYAARMLCYLSILTAMTALPLIHRSIRYKMHEVEAVTRFSSAKLLAAKLIILGLGDIFMLTGILIIASAKTFLQTGSIALYLLFPYLLASGGTLFLLGHLNTRHLIPGSAAFYTLLILTIVSLKQICPLFFQQTLLSGGWMAICAGLTAFCIHQIRHLVYDVGYAEMQMN